MSKINFAAALKSSAPPPPPDPQPSGPAPAPPAASPKIKRKHIGGYFEPEVARRLRMLASEEETTVQELLTEALRLMFEKRDLSVL